MSVDSGATLTERPMAEMVAVIMAGTSLLALLDDISSVLDDIATLTQVATRKTAGVLGDDLALNAEQVSGMRADRELPVVWKVAKGSLINKAILVPAALAISAFAPWGVGPLLMIGGAYLCFEGFEKIVHAWRHARESGEVEVAPRLPVKLSHPVDVDAFERAKVRGAIRTDFVLSAEIVTIALGTVAAAPLLTQLLVLSALSVVMTVGVYGLVAGIVKLDDLGVYLCTHPGRRAGLSRLGQALGRGILRAAPWFLKSLSVVGTLAMFLVGGGILLHGVPGAHHALEGVVAEFESLGSLVPSALTSLAGGLAGILVGALAWLLLSQGKRLLGRG